MTHTSCPVLLADSHGPCAAVRCAALLCNMVYSK
jgi:hypothetical protein